MDFGLMVVERALELGNNCPYCGIAQISGILIRLHELLRNHNFPQSFLLSRCFFSQTAVKKQFDLRGRSYIARYKMSLSETPSLPLAVALR